MGASTGLVATTGALPPAVCTGFEPHAANSPKTAAAQTAFIAKRFTTTILV